MAKSVPVTPRGGKWAASREGSQRASAIHDTQREAEKKGRQIARNDKAEFVLQGKQGRIMERDSYGGDPSSSKG